MNPEHDVFLSSAWYGLDAVRSGLANWLERQGYDAFVFERFKEESVWKSLLPAAREGICLDHVSRSRLYVGFFRTTYGSSARDHAADIAFTDLELFEAFRTGVPIRLYLLADANPDSRLTSLLLLVEAVLPGVLVCVSTEAELRDRVKRDIDTHFGRRIPLVVPASRFKRYSRAIIGNRKIEDDSNEGLRFLQDRYPAPELPFDADLVRAELVEIRTLQSYQARLNATYRVFQRLFHVPWFQTHDHLDLWDDALSIWESAAAWLGLHGFIYAGRLAADNTLVTVRVLKASAGELSSLAELIRKGETRTGTQEEWINLYATGGALASEYYSIAKQAHRSLKPYYLAKADSWIGVAERTSARRPDQKREAGLASIRGHIVLEWGRCAEAIPILERSLQIREEAALGAASVGEAKVDLGYAYYLAGRRHKAERLIAAGLGDLERHGSPGFVGRAKRKAARFYATNWGFGKALRELVDVKDLVDTYALTDQGRGVRWISRLPNFILRSLRTRENPASRTASSNREEKI